MTINDICQDLNEFISHVSSHEDTEIKLQTYRHYSVFTEKILAVGGVAMRQSLTDEDWMKFLSMIDTHSDNQNTSCTVEKLLDVINKMSGDSHSYEVHRNTVDATDAIKCFPDISIVVKGADGGIMESIVVPVMIGESSDLQSASAQAAGYLAQKLCNFIDLYGLQERLHGFWVATNGLLLAFGHISITNDKVRMLSTGGDYHDFLPVDGNYPP